MKKLIVALFCVIMAGMFLPANANLIDKSDYVKVLSIGNKLVKANNITHRYTFNFTTFAQQNAFPILFDEATSYLNDMDLHNNRVVAIFAQDYLRLSTNDEVAALMAHELAQGEHSYTGLFNGQMMFTKNGTCPFNYFAKKNELKFDKTAVDYLVKAGYNPRALVSALNKTTGEWRGTFWGRHNKTSVRTKAIENYIKANYPKY